MDDACRTEIFKHALGNFNSEKRFRFWKIRTFLSSFWYSGQAPSRHAIVRYAPCEPVAEGSVRFNDVIAEIKVFTRQELASLKQDFKDGKKDAKKYIIIDNKLYDVTDFIEDHPGGAAVLMTHVGKDASGTMRRRDTALF